ncbi:ferri-bacillibactin esterase BesA [Paenibacillus marchantiophytorum]|uniref:Ferri-bacillibactin esterase BesA n=1 Tax=Paenibacillus marchantiophytorum TaxID=1619310 RepID=A0ABQ1FI82_9BACL|nr:alpha/beta hydrolase [Paenibacillus marchantiophytorum]GGA16377.1 ferri-bacillibactin esterase BesA [Paenibacillus marchantiophytorum]
MTRLDNDIPYISQVENSLEAFSLPNTQQFLLPSKARQQPYRIFVYTPAQEAPPQGFPVLYLLDANALFGTIVEAVRVQARRPEKTGVYPAIIVGIGYPTDEPFDDSRYYDFTMPTSDEVLKALPVRNKDHVWPKVGGAQDFRDFIEQELKPRIERDYPVDWNRQGIFGHSLGGLFVLQTLLTMPDSFQFYVAGSPSIHWNKELVRRQEAQFAALQQQARKRINLLITLGELEDAHPSGMNGNAREFFERFSLLTSEELRVEYQEFEGEGHVSVLPALVSRMLRFVLGG